MVNLDKIRYKKVCQHLNTTRIWKDGVLTLTSLAAERRKKYNPQRYNKSGITISTSFDIIALDLLCSFVTSSNKSVKRSQLLSLRNLMSCLDMDMYSRDKEKKLRIDFINSGLEARLKYNLNDRNIVLKHIYGGLTEDINTSRINLTELSNEEISWIVSTIAGALDFGTIERYVDDLLDVCTRFKTADYAYKNQIVDELKNQISVIQNEFRHTKTLTQGSGYFCLRPEVFNDRITSVHNALRNPSNMLRSGMQGINNMLQGGFESTRAYLFLGLPGEGKSLMLLNLAYQIKLCNQDYKPKDPTKTPCVVYLTMENMDRETLTRLYNISTSNGCMTDKSAEEVIYDMQTIGQLTVDGNNGMDLIIKYVPDFSVDTSYLYDFTEELEDDGYEVCCFIQDYIKKIRPINYTGDPYQDLGSVVSEMKTYAVLNDVPIITASQCNREAAKIIDQKRRTNSTDLVKQLGRDNTGESIQVINNSDAVMMLTPEYDMNDNKYLGVSLVKRRYTNTYTKSVQYIFLPFAPNNGIRLLMDLNSDVPLYKETMNEPNSVGMKNSVPYANIGIKNSSYMASNSIKDMDEEDNSSNLNLNSASYVNASEAEPICPFVIMAS